MDITDPHTFRDNSRLRMGLEELRARKTLGTVMGTELKLEEYLDADTAVRVWVDDSGHAHTLGRPFPYTGEIERRELNPATGRPAWRLVEYFDATAPHRHQPPVAHPGPPWINA